jgi:cobaltochelatase CobS
MDTPQVYGEPTGRQCPKCSAAMIWKINRRSRKYFHACPNYYVTGCPGKIGAPRGKPFGEPKSEPTNEPVTVTNPEPTNEPSETMNETETNTTPAKVAQTGQTLDVIGGALYEALKPLIQAEIDRRAAEIAAKAIASCKFAGTKVEWTINGAPFAKVDGTHHYMLGEVLALRAAGFKNIMLVGPAGSGKTQLASDVAKALELPFTAVSITAGLPEWHLIGRGTPNLQTGENVYQSSPVVDLYESGGVILLDEIDKGDPNTMAIMHTALANGHWNIPARTANPVAKRHENAMFICAANTYGTGADRQYVGSNALDAAFLNRFTCATLEVDYDKDLETSLVGDAQILNRVWNIRDKVKQLGLRRVVGTRDLVAVTMLVKAGGKTLDHALKCLTISWTNDERSRVGVN